MALTDLKKGILEEARAKAQAIQEESRAATHSVIEEARKQAASITKETHGALQAQEKLGLQEAEADAQAAASALLSAALDGAVNVNSSASGRCCSTR